MYTLCIFSQYILSVCNTNISMEQMYAKLNLKIRPNGRNVKKLLQTTLSVQKLRNKQLAISKAKQTVPSVVMDRQFHPLGKSANLCTQNNP